MKKDESNNNSRGEAFNEMLRRAMKGSGQENAESSPVNEQTDDKPAFAEPIYRAAEADEFFTLFVTTAGTLSSAGIIAAIVPSSWYFIS